MKRRRKWIIIGAAVILVFIILFNIRSAKGKNPTVTVDKVQKRRLVEMVTATGEIKPKKNINISTDMAGKILKIFVKEGDWVKKDQMLIKLDSTFYEASAERDKGIISSAEADLISQEANLKKATQFFNRRKELFDQGLISKEQYEDAQIQLDIAGATRENNIHRIEQAQASLKTSLNSIHKTNIISPIDGIVTSLKVEEGEVAIIGTMNNPGTVLMTIADLSVMEAEVKVDETDVVKVKKNKKAEVKVDALPDVKIKGVVTEIGNSALVPIGTSTTTSSEARDFKTVITLTDPPLVLKPGFSATADIIIEEKENCLSVPIASLVIQEFPDPKEKDKKNEKEGVFIAENGKAKFREITKGISGDMYIEITSGLKENEEIITGPFEVLKKIKNDDRIRIEKQKKNNGKYH